MSDSGVDVRTAVSPLREAVRIIAGPFGDVRSGADWQAVRSEKYEMAKDGITQFLIEHAGVAPVSFHMPGHKGSEIYKRFGYEDFISDMIDCDITEIPGADNLFQMEGIIGQTAAKYRGLYGVKRSYLLVNGTSGGLIAGILAAVPAGGKLVMARNCHKSVFNALTLGGLQPVYAYPGVLEEYGISGAVEASEIARCLDENPDAAAVILPSPNYYGICSDIEAIAEVVHSRDKVLIVDQAHGAHLKFMPDMPAAAEACGADIVVNSTHKTLVSFTQSAVLNLNSDRVDRYVLEDKLQSIQSTSPSYLLMASLDMNADIMMEHGVQLFKEWQENLEWFYCESALRVPELKVMKDSAIQCEAVSEIDAETLNTQRLDATKLNLDMSRYGINGAQLEELLMAEGIFPELVTGNILMCMTGIGNTRSDYEKLLAALEKIAENAFFEKASDVSERCGGFDVANSGYIWTKKRPMHAVPFAKRLRHIDECEGAVCASSIIPYPPGIPLICPGEQIGRDEIEYIKLLRQQGEKVIGINEKYEIFVGV